ncbi:MAG: hypothetical protein QOE51_5067 [Actinoplanes sp.]|jgi:hypothetical protein|nr:hypothetical protein [Actinoplanes sp.]
MSRLARPLLAVRLIGCADVVTAQKAQLMAHLVESFGDAATCRTSTRPGSYTGEIRMYLTVTSKEASPR